MSWAPFDVAMVVDRIRTLVPSLRLVGMAADYASVKSLRDFTPPSAYVLLAQETFEPNPSGSSMPGVQRTKPQRARVAIGVVVAARNYREQAGAQLTGTLGELLGQVRGVLAGWTPNTAGARALELRRGDLLQYDDATALWCDVWSTQHITGGTP